MSQTTVENQPVGSAGDRADASSGDVISRVAEIDLPFGRYAVYGTDPERQALLPGAAGDVTDNKKAAGFVKSTHALESNLTGVPRYLALKMANLMRAGRMFVEVETNVDTDDDVFIRFQGGNEGKARNDADGGDAAILPKAKFTTVTSAGKLAIVEFDFRG